MNASGILHLYHMVTACDGVYEYWADFIESWHSMLRHWLIRLLKALCALPVAYPDKLKAVIYCLEKEGLFLEGDVADCIVEAIEKSLTAGISDANIVSSILSPSSTSPTIMGSKKLQQDEGTVMYGSRESMSSSSMMYGSRESMSSKKSSFSFGSFSTRPVSSSSGKQQPGPVRNPNPIQVESKPKEKPFKIVSQLMANIKFTKLTSKFPELNLTHLSLQEFMNEVFKQYNASTLQYASQTIAIVFQTDEVLLSRQKSESEMAEMVSVSAAFKTSNSVDEFKAQVSNYLELLLTSGQGGSGLILQMNITTISRLSEDLEMLTKYYFQSNTIVAARSASATRPDRIDRVFGLYPNKIKNNNNSNRSLSSSSSSGLGEKMRSFINYELKPLRDIVLAIQMNSKFLPDFVKTELYK
eukprot:gene22770-29482_t